MVHPTKIHEMAIKLSQQYSKVTTEDIFLRKTAYLGGFSAFLVCFLQFGRLLFCGGFEAKKWVR